MTLPRIEPATFRLIRRYVKYLMSSKRRELIRAPHHIWPKYKLRRCDYLQSQIEHFLKLSTLTNKMH